MTLILTGHILTSTLRGIKAAHKQFVEFIKKNKIKLMIKRLKEKRKGLSGPFPQKKTDTESMGVSKIVGKNIVRILRTLPKKKSVNIVGIALCLLVQTS